MTKIQLKEYSLAEFENIEKVISELFSIIAPGKSDYSNVERAAICTYVHNFYNGVENLIKRVLSFKGIIHKETPTWHKDLLKLVLKTGLLDQELHDDLVDFLSFRHYFVHSYFFSIHWNELKPLVEKLPRTFENTRATIFHFLENC